MNRAGKPLQVYVVEDSDIIRRLLTSAIESAGGELVGAADNAQQAIRQLQELKPHLILIDLVLTSGSGFEVLDALRAGGVARGATTGRATSRATTPETTTSETTTSGTAGVRPAPAPRPQADRPSPNGGDRAPESAPAS